jgi:AAA domain
MEHVMANDTPAPGSAQSENNGHSATTFGAGVDQDKWIIKPNGQAGSIIEVRHRIEVPDFSALTKLGLAASLFIDIEDTPSRDMLVEKMIPAGALACLFGRPGEGKSLTVGDLGAHIAAGMSTWLGRRIMTSGSVLYVAAERAAVVKRRLLAFRRHHDVGDIPMAVISGQINFRGIADHAGAIAAAADQLDKTFHVPPALVIIETVNRIIPGGDENSSRDMGHVISKSTLIQEKTGGVVMLVHHTPSGDESRMRGHTSLLGAMDTTLRNLRQDVTPDDIFTCKVEKTSEEFRGEYVRFKLKSLLLGISKDGSEVHAPIVELAPDGASPSVVKPEKALKGDQFIMMELLLDAGHSGLTQDEWYKQAKNEGVGVTKSGNVREAALTETRRRLQKKNLVHLDDGRYRALKRFQPVGEAGHGLRFGGPRAPHDRKRKA